MVFICFLDKTNKFTGKFKSIISSIYKTFTFLSYKMLFYYCNYVEKIFENKEITTIYFTCFLEERNIFSANIKASVGYIIIF